MHTRFPAQTLITAVVMTALLTATALAQESEQDAAAVMFDDAPLEDPLGYPDWFKQSFLYLRDDLEDALSKGKAGLIVYFGQRRCAYCKMLMDVNFGLTDIVTYTRRHFDVVPIDIWSTEEVATLDGKVMTGRQYALREDTNFTPSLLFYDEEGKEVLRLRGYYPPYRFRAALEYVADDHYRRESFPEYLERADPTLSFELGGLNEEEFFSPPPYNLDRSRLPGDRPLVVFFEQTECHACDVLHSQPLRDPVINRAFERFENVQLNMWSDTPVITPDGRRTTARDWARSMGLFYAPSLVFFDEEGREIIRVDSVVRFYRLRSVLNYILSRGYLAEPNYQEWRRTSEY